MRTAAMCFSLLQVPRCRISTLASSWLECFQSISRSSRTSLNLKLFGSSICSSEGGHTRRWTRRPITTKTSGRKLDILSSKTNDIRLGISDGKFSTSATLDGNKIETSEVERIQYCGFRTNIAENKDIAKLTTIIVFDLETTGLSRENDRIIEIALQDLQGGENSTFQTLINPERYVANHHIHGISTHMVCRPDVPRMKDLIPILMQYIKSRQKPGGLVLLIAHNARCFDVPFLVKEFNRCHFEVPSDWLFLDTLPMARKLMKSEGHSKTSLSLLALREYFKINSNGPAHRAMSDVRMLSLILQRLTFVLKMSVSGLVEESFKVSELNSSKKKKNSR